MMRARILFRDSQGRDGQVELSPAAPIYVGRGLDCAIRTDDAMVSRKHSMIRLDGDHFMVEDLGSANGTHVNDVPVQKHALAHNDVVRCGSLWLRYVEEAPVASSPAIPMVAAPTPKRGGTVRLDRNAGAPVATKTPSPPAYADQGPPSINWSGDDLRVRSAVARQSDPAIDVPEGVIAGGATSGSFQYEATNPSAGEPSVVVDFDGGDGGRVRSELASLREDFDKLQIQYDQEAAQTRRLRAELSTQNDRLDEQRRAIQDRDERVAAHGRVADELREEVRQVTGELAQARAEVAELSESVAARERQLSRAQEDIARLKDDSDDKDRALSELSKTKDEGWKKLNEQLGEIEHLREVIGEQERLLEERRVGLVAQEEVIKELRTEQGKATRKMAQLSAERDELSVREAQKDAEIAAVGDENRRLGRLLAELQTRGQSDEDTEHAVKLAGQLKDLRVEIRKLEADRDRLAETAKRAEDEAETLSDRLAQVEVDQREASTKLLAAEGKIRVAEDALAKSEVARHKAAEEAIDAAKARDAAMSSADEARRDADRAARHVAKLEADAADHAATVARLESELAAAKEAGAQQAQQAQQASEPVPVAETSAAEDAAAAEAAAEAARVAAEIRTRAGEVHDQVNDVLSELRQNLLLVQGEFSTPPGERSGDSDRMIHETLDALIGNAEDAKGILRTLRQLAESD